MAGLAFVLKDPGRPECELKRFGESAVDFGVGFRVSGVDGGQNKYISPVLFAIRNACKANRIGIPCPHRVVEIKGDARA